MSENSYVTITDIPVAMGFAEFVEDMRERLQEEYPDCEVRVVPVTKNNDTHLTGIAVIPPGADMWATVYVDSCYEKYLEGRPMEEIISHYIRNREEAMPEKDIPRPDITDFEAVRDIICCRLVNRERNREWLGQIPHRDFLNLAVIYYIPVDIGPGEDGSASITMTDAHAAAWPVDQDTLFSIALANTERLFPAVIRPMEEIIRELCPGLSVRETGLHILRNNGGVGGAAAMLSGGILRKFAAGHGDFYILPSSIFEVLLVPVANPFSTDPAFYTGMVRDVNRTQVEPEEVLSDNAYLYHADTGVIDILE